MFVSCILVFYILSSCIYAYHYFFYILFFYVIKYYNVYFFFYCYGHHRVLHVLTHSSPTRRSSDLGAALLQGAQSVQPHGVEALENVVALAVARGAAVFVNETLYFLEPGDDALFARSAPALLLRLGKVGEFVTQFVKVEVSHSGPRPYSARRRLHPRP